MKPQLSLLATPHIIPCRPVVLNIWVATQNWVAGNIPMGREYFIRITLFFILDEP
jgi:hypothetical protein